MKQIQNVFKYGLFEVRTVTISGVPWFVAKDVCDVLGISNNRDAISRLDDDEKQTVVLNDTLSRNPNTQVVNEPGLYSLILGSRKPEAREFKRWITHEVIPTIRKHGAYVTPTKLEELIRDPDVMIQLLTELKREQQERARLQLETERQAEVIEEQAGRLTYLDEIMRSEDTMNVTQIAADYGMTARQLNAILKEAGIQRYTGGQWVLCAKHLRKGLTKSVTHPIALESGGTKNVVHTRWTQAGRLLIHQTLAERGIHANQDQGIDAGVLVIRREAQSLQDKAPTLTLNLHINA